jgi:hypothetical protein
LAEKIILYYKQEQNMDVLMERLYDVITETKKSGSDQLSKLHSVIITSDNSLELLEQVFQVRMREHGITTPMDVGEFFFGIKHPKVSTLLQIVKKNPKFNFTNLNSSYKKYFGHISRFAELLKIGMEYSTDPESVEGLDYKIRRMFVDWNLPSENVWYNCEKVQKRKYKKTHLNEEEKMNSTSKTQTNFQITKMGQVIDLVSSKGKKDVILGLTHKDCLENFLKRLMKTINCRRIIFDYFEKLFAVELREYKKKEKLLTIIGRMYQKVPREKTEEEINDFTTFLHAQNKAKEKKIDEQKIEEVKKVFIKGDNLHVVDGKFMVLTYATKPFQYV